MYRALFFFSVFILYYICPPFSPLTPASLPPLTTLLSVSRVMHVCIGVHWLISARPPSSGGEGMLEGGADVVGGGDPAAHIRALEGQAG